ncbi:hypothetical protein HanRHA438_Chr14g0660931 [Helianthus annuus]|uniref:Uncharacterized protein n=1 Tax=Helianthus annuus TaxID=4232 RepID=A0A251SIG0_HELAN|nr:hypothetical protein HanXRQr2_Chr14g0650251 [Helianthus annuus]KAJ0464588.1 hypothetical protein HanHA300_Chr14g0529031 [Helianthus annuus]KAJ0469195.1 hypothetical protein HanIR_Chr14g0705261 [Helianthus annuus]KAJ0486184.1 hypothetical protein HanHA89_Chr14g0576891 [Helianthus annuus]KAJ0656734.1 hypothetical protein HanLR1_Chr14g0539281 [Helianthus annuus]
MRWDELKPDFNQEQEPEQQETIYLEINTLSLISKPKDYYQIIEVEYEAAKEEI